MANEERGNGRLTKSRAWAGPGRLPLYPEFWGIILTGTNPLSVRYVSTVDLPESLVPMIAMNMLPR